MAFRQSRLDGNIARLAGRVSDGKPAGLWPFSRQRLIGGVPAPAHGAASGRGRLPVAVAAGGAWPFRFFAARYGHTYYFHLVGSGTGLASGGLPFIGTLHPHRT